MKILNKLELKIEGFEKCNIVCDHDCPLGQIYDYITAIQSFCIQKMKESQEQQSKEQSSKVEELQQEQA